MYDDDNTSMLFHPSRHLFHIHLTGEEWIFKIKDTDASAPSPTPYECDLSAIAPNSLLGEPFSSNNWNVNVVTVDVDLNLNRLATGVEPVRAFLNKIKDTLETSGKATVEFSIDNAYELIITPINIGLDDFNFAQPLSYGGANGDSISISQTISNTPVNFNSVDFQALPDKDNKNKTDIISITNTSIEYYSDIFSNNIGMASPTLLSDFSYTSIDLQSDSNKIYIGAGGNINSPPKIALKTKRHELIGESSSSTMKIEDFNLDTYSESSDFKEGVTDIGDTVLFPLHGTAQNGAGKEILYGDNTSVFSGETWSDDDKTSYLDYDYITIAETSSSTLTAFLSTNTVRIGQIILIHANEEDTSDEAFLQWKQYDYDASATQTYINELYMYCGEAEHATTPYPILRYIGVLSTAGGTNAFAYSYKEHSLSIGQISLTTSIDTDAFNGAICVGTNGSAGPGITPTSGGTNVQIRNTGSRTTVLNLRDVINSLPNNTYISALCPCSSPLLYNSWGLAGGVINTSEDLGNPIEPYNYLTSDIFYNNGNLKYLARHGIFWMSFENSPNTLYKINTIDFHQLTEAGAMFDKMVLNFNNIPSELCNPSDPNSVSFNDDNGIINVNIADQEFSNSRHFQSSDVASNDISVEMEGQHGTGTYSETVNPPTDFAWSNTPDSDTIIVGLCETFECGRIKMIQHLPSVDGSPSNDVNPIEFLVAPCDTTVSKNTGDTFATGVSAQNEEGYDTITMAADNSSQYSARLTTGDKVRFIGLPLQSTSSPETNVKFNVDTPVYEVNMVDTDKFIIDAKDNNPGLFNGDYLGESIAATTNENNTSDINKAFWWNSKIWVLYAKKNKLKFSRWDLFLYNANTLDISKEIGAQRTLNMADRTPPYAEAGHYFNNVLPTGEKFYYPYVILVSLA